MSPLTPLAVSHADVLRHLAENPGDDHLAIAKATGRIASNVKRDMPRLAGEGLVGDTGALTGAGMEALRALARAEGAEPPPAAGAAPEGYVELVWAQIAPDPLNPRKHFDPEGIAELARSIVQDGLLENLVVRVADPSGHGVKEWVKIGDAEAQLYRLVAGERRHRAIGQLIEAGQWGATAPILCKVIATDDVGHRRLALVENLQRKDLRPIDEATALKELMAVTGQGTAEIAAEIGFTQRFVQQRLQLLDLPPIKQVELQDGKITIEAARQYLAAAAGRLKPPPEGPRAPPAPEAAEQSETTPIPIGSETLVEQVLRHMRRVDDEWVAKYPATASRSPTASTLEEAAEALQSLQRQLEEAREALRPFARFSDNYKSDGTQLWLDGRDATGHVFGIANITANLRLAASTLGRLEGGGSSNASPSPLDATRRSSDLNSQPSAQGEDQ